MTLENSQPTFFEEMELPLMSSPGGSRAKIYRVPGSKRESRRGVAGYGLSCAESLAKYDQNSQSWRTSQTFLLESGEVGLEEFSGTWPRSGMMRSGTAFRLPPLAHRTDETESGLLPTPRKGCAMEFCFPAHSMIKVWNKGSSVSGPSSALVALGVSRHLILAAYARMMGFPPGWAKLQAMGTPSSHRSQNSSEEQS